MLILPPGHAEAVRVRRALTTREKRLTGAVLATVAVLIVAVVLALVIPGHKSGNGCIYATIPANAMTGGEEIYQCGDTARSTCQSVTTPGAFTALQASSIEAECRKAGLPVGH